MTETISYSKILKEDLLLEPRNGTLEVRLADGSVITGSAVDIAYLLGDAYTTAAMPSNAATGQLARQTDGERGLVMRSEASKWFHLLGGAVNVDHYATLAAAVSDIGSTARTLIIGSAQTVSSALTIPTNVSLVFLGRAGRINPSSGVTVTINGPVQAPPHQIFGTDGTISFGAQTMAEVWGNWWGMTGDDSTVNTTAFQRALTGCPTGGKIKLTAGTFRSSDVTCDKPLIIEGAGPNATILLYTGTGRFIDRTAETADESFQQFGLRDVELKVNDTTAHAVLLTIRGGVRDVICENVRFNGNSGTGRAIAVAIISTSSDGSFYHEFIKCHFRNIWMGIYGTPGNASITEVAVIGGRFGGVKYCIFGRIGSVSALTTRFEGTALQTALYTDSTNWRAMACRFERTGGFDAGTFVSGTAGSVVDAGADTLTYTSHGFSNDDEVVVEATTTVPGGLSDNTVYWVKVSDPNTIQLAATPSGSAIDITSAGAGTIIVRKLTATPGLFGRNSEHIYGWGNNYNPFTSGETLVFDGTRSHDENAQQGHGLFRLKNHRTGSAATAMIDAITGQTTDLFQFRDSGSNNVTLINESAQLELAAGQLIIGGSGSPESAVTAPVGSIWLRSNGGASTTLYVKESGSGNTGWVAK